MPYVTMYWNGGSGYAPADVHDSSQGEVFRSLAGAVREFSYRRHDRRYPCVDIATCEAWIFKGADVVGEEYPDIVLRFGPRGGVIIERI